MIEFLFLIVISSAFGFFCGVYFMYYFISSGFEGNLNKVLYCYKNGMIKFTDKYWISTMSDDLNNLLIGLLLGLIIGVTSGLAICWNVLDSAFDGEYDRASYEWKLNKEKQNDTTKNWIYVWDTWRV